MTKYICNKENVFTVKKKKKSWDNVQKGKRCEWWSVKKRFQQMRLFSTGAHTVSLALAAASLASQAADVHLPGAHSLIHAVHWAFVFTAELMAHKPPGEESQFPPDCAFLSNYACLFLSQQILDESCVCARAHLHTNCELCQFSQAGCQTFCCFSSKYSHHLVVRPKKGLLAIFSCLGCWGWDKIRVNQILHRVKSSSPNRLSAFDSESESLFRGPGAVVSQGFHVGQNAPCGFLDVWPTLLAKSFRTQ